MKDLVSIEFEKDVSTIEDSIKKSKYPQSFDRNMFTIKDKVPAEF